MAKIEWLQADVASAAKQVEEAKARGDRNINYLLNNLKAAKRRLSFYMMHPDHPNLER